MSSVLPIEHEFLYIYAEQN